MNHKDTKSTKDPVLTIPTFGRHGPAADWTGIAGTWHNNFVRFVAFVSLWFPISHSAQKSSH